MKNLHSKMIGIIFAILAVSIFSFADVCIKATSAHYDPFSVALYMNIVTFLFLLPIVWKVGGFKKALKTKHLKTHALRSYFLLINFLCIIYAFSMLPLATIYIIIFSLPFILNFMAMVVLKEKISSHRWVAIIIGLSGILIALRPDIIVMSLGLLAAAIGTFFNAGSTIANKFINKKDHWLAYTLYLMMFQIPVIAIIVLLRGGSLIPDLTDMGTMPWFVAGGFAYMIALSLFPQAIQRVDASIVGSLIYIAFPWGVLYGYFIFGDSVDRWTLGGAVIIILSGLFLIYRERKEHSELLEMEENVTVSKR